MIVFLGLISTSCHGEHNIWRVTSLASSLTLITNLQSENIFVFEYVPLFIVNCVFRFKKVYIQSWVADKIKEYLGIQTLCFIIFHLNTSNLFVGNNFIFAKNIYLYLSFLFNFTKD